MSRGLTVFKRVTAQTLIDKQDIMTYVVAEFDTDNATQKELMQSRNLESLLSQLPDLERRGGYDGGVVIDLATPIE